MFFLDHFIFFNRVHFHISIDDSWNPDGKNCFRYFTEVYNFFPQKNPKHVRPIRYLTLVGYAFIFVSFGVLISLDYIKALVIVLFFSTVIILSLFLFHFLVIEILYQYYKGEKCSKICSKLKLIGFEVCF